VKFLCAMGIAETRLRNRVTDEVDYFWKVDGPEVL
jgi:hypothetical protein